MDAVRQVRKTIAEHDLFSPGEMIVVGVSGGPDSLALLHILRELRDELRISLHVAHLNHQLRGTESDADAVFVEGIAREWGLAFTGAARDVRALAGAQQRSLEEAARLARYAFLAEVAQSIGALTIAVAHNADDQVETVLMHFLRGAGLAGLRGMLYDVRFQISDFGFSSTGPSRSSQLEEASKSESEIRNLQSAIRLVRPLLDVRRADIVRYCSEHALTPRQDLSNLDTTFFRNRLRFQVLPALEKVNPNLRQVLLHTARVLADEYDLLQSQVREAYAKVAYQEADSIVFARLAWRELHPALQRGTLRMAIQTLRRHLRDIDWTHVEDARRIALDKGAGAQATLPAGMVLDVGYEDFVIHDAARPHPPPDLPLLNVESLAIRPGITPLPDSAWLVETEITDQYDKSTSRWTAVLDPDKVNRPLVLRQRQPGDRFQPAGMNGQDKSLHEFMIDAKIPRAVRDHLPILVAGDRIAWVCGWRVDERARVTTETRQFLRVAFRKQTQR